MANKTGKKVGEKVYVVGVGMTKFEKPGRRENWDYPDMARESGTNALADAGIDFSAVEQGFGMVTVAVELRTLRQALAAQLEAARTASGTGEL